MTAVADDILDAAARLFADRGYERTGMNDIAKSAKVAMPTLYRHFQNKRNLYNRACIWIFSRKAQAHWRQLTELNEGGDPLHLFNYLQALAQDFMEDKVYFGLMHRELMDSSTQGLRELSEQSFSYAFSELCKLCGRIRPDEDSWLLGLALHSMLFGAVDMLRFGTPLHPSFKSIGNSIEITRFTLNALLPEIDWSNMGTPTPQPRKGKRQRA